MYLRFKFRLIRNWIVSPALPPQWGRDRERVPAHETLLQTTTP